MTVIFYSVIWYLFLYRSGLALASRESESVMLPVFNPRTAVISGRGAQQQFCSFSLNHNFIPY